MYSLKKKYQLLRKVLFIAENFQNSKTEISIYLNVFIESALFVCVHTRYQTITAETN